MAAKKAAKTELEVLVSDKVANGQGGYFRKGTTFEPGEGCDVAALKEAGLVK